MTISHPNKTLSHLEMLYNANSSKQINGLNLVINSGDNIN